MSDAGPAEVGEVAVERGELAGQLDERRVAVPARRRTAPRAAAVFRSPVPPTRIGGPPGVTGAGEFHASVTEWWVPAKVVCRWVNMPVQICSASSSRSKRSATGGNRTSSASCSSSNHAAPMPSSARPFEMTSSAVTAFASSAGLRYVTPVTRVPRRAVCVRAASAPSSVYASNISSSGGPMQRELEEVVHHEHGVEAGLLAGDRHRRDPLEQRLVALRDR